MPMFQILAKDNLRDQGIFCPQLYCNMEELPGMHMLQVKIKFR